MCIRRKKNKESCDCFPDIQEKMEQLKVFRLTAEKQTNEALEKVLEARSKGLRTQEEQARGMMSKSVAMKKQADGMLMTLEIAVQARDLVLLQGKFLNCMEELTQTIGDSLDNSRAKRVGRRYIKVMRKSKKQADSIDRLIKECDFVTAVFTNTDGNSPYDDEVDLLIKKAEAQRKESSNKQEFKI